MASITLHLPDDLLARLKHRAVVRGFDDPGQFLESLLVDGLQDQEGLPGQVCPHISFQSEEELEALLLEGLASGPAKELTDSDWNEKRKRLIERHTRQGV